MSEANAIFKGEAVYRRSTETLTLDRRVFKICEVKEARFGLLRRKVLFVHFDGDKWDVLHADEDFTDVKHYRLR